MGTKLRSKMTEHTIKRFWGGYDRGVCVQITASKPLQVRETAFEQIQEEGFIQLTVEEAVALRDVLSRFISGSMEFFVEDKRGG